MIDFGKESNELKEELDNIMEKFYKEYLEEGLYLEFFTSTNINNYLKMLYELGYVDKPELNSDDTFYVFNIHFRTLIRIKVCRYSLKVSKYIIDNNELEKYIYYKDMINI